ncbi:anti-sigma factor family protein [Ohtaekwangia sp.]|uniref:anti-sigma factor family protein n=1 Tax=Ohtaekwangia sp. TaxID=2066019 RepID=UPI002FDD8138
MSYKPDQQDWMAYLYGELEGAEKEKMEHYLLSDANARKELEKFQQLRKMMGAVEDKEVIAPPIVLGDNGQQRFIWNTPVFRTVASIAASLLIIMLVGRFTGTQMSLSGNEFKISFGEPRKVDVPSVAAPSLTVSDVQSMINQSLDQNNQAMQASWKETQQKLDQSIRSNLASNSGKIDRLVKEASTASQEQIRQFVSTLQSQNTEVVKNYFQLSSSEQKKYIENLLVDFAKYLQQQRTDDLQLVQTRLNALEQNTDIFRQETEQILSSIITTVGATETKETKY